MIHRCSNKAVWNEDQNKYWERQHRTTKSSRHGDEYSHGNLLEHLLKKLKWSHPQPCSWSQNCCIHCTRNAPYAPSVAKVFVEETRHHNDCTTHNTCYYTLDHCEQGFALLACTLAWVHHYPRGDSSKIMLDVILCTLRDVVCMV